MDYNRFKYETAQRAKESRKKATNTSIKEMKYRPKIGSGDFVTKTRQVGKFLEDGHKVKVTIMFRGREVSHPELGMKILEDLAEQVSSVAKVEAAPKLDGRNMTMVLAPDRRARQAARKTTAPTTPAPGTAGPSAVAPAGDGSTGAAGDGSTGAAGDGSTGAAGGSSGGDDGPWPSKPADAPAQPAASRPGASQSRSAAAPAVAAAPAGHF